MRRGFLIFVACVAGLFYGWDRAITQNGIVQYVDDHPDMWKADFTLYSLASYHELFNNDAKALAIFRRVVDRYPESSYADVCQYGVAASLERLKRRPECIVEYKIYLKKFPEGRFRRSVRRNLDIMGY